MIKIIYLIGRKTVTTFYTELDLKHDRNGPMSLLDSAISCAKDHLRALDDASRFAVIDNGKLVGEWVKNGHQGVRMFDPQFVVDN